MAQSLTRIIDREAYHYLDPQAFVVPTQVIPYSAALLLGFKCSLSAWSGEAADMVLTIFCSFADKAGYWIKRLVLFQ